MTEKKMQLVDCESTSSPPPHLGAPNSAQPLLCDVYLASFLSHCVLNALSLVGMLTIYLVRAG